jgi:segregation and condensation protein A
MAIYRQAASTVDVGAEFIATAATLVWLKSKMLLPVDEQVVDEIGEEDPHFEIIHHLIEYSRFKDAAKDLTERERQQRGHFSRGMSASPDLKRPLGIDHLTIDDLTALFKEIAAKSSPKKGLVEGETWKLADKITEFRELLLLNEKILFKTLFSYEKSRLELIVSFLAILELMKLGEICVIKNEESNIMIIAR